jgi:hypothetical protein
VATRHGFPAIPTPGVLALSPIQSAVNNIRERFQNVEAELAVLASIVGASTTAQAVQSLQIQIAQLTAALNALEAQIGLSDLDAATMLAMDSRVKATVQQEVFAAQDAGAVSALLRTDSRMRAIADDAARSAMQADSAHNVIANRVFRA